MSSDFASEMYSSKSSDYFANSRNEMLEFVPYGIGSVLDVGCSAGSFGRIIKENRDNCEVWGIEPNDSAAEMASNQLDHVICGTLQTSYEQLGGKLFDCVIFNDVLEHFVQPDAVLIDVKKCLSREGFVVASIPNILFFDEMSKILLSEDWRYEDEGIMDRTHLRFFTKKSIIRLFETTGYQIDILEGINPILSTRYKLANALTLGRLRDWRYLQFGVRASISGV